MPTIRSPRSPASSSTSTPPTPWAHKIDDGKDRLFGDLGNDWLVGGTQNDRLFGGMGDDVHNLDDNHDTANNNEQPDAVGVRRPRLRLRRRRARRADRQHRRRPHVRLHRRVQQLPGAVRSRSATRRSIRSPSPHVDDFLRGLARKAATTSRLPEPALHLDGELGLTSQEDPEWGDQHGGPRDPQPGHTHASRDTQGGPEDDRATALPLAGASWPASPELQATPPIPIDVTVNNITVTQDPDSTDQRALFVAGGAGNERSRCAAARATPTSRSSSTASARIRPRHRRATPSIASSSTAMAATTPSPSSRFEARSAPPSSAATATTRSAAAEAATSSTAATATMPSSAAMAPTSSWEA